MLIFGLLHEGCDRLFIYSFTHSSAAVRWADRELQQELLAGSQPGDRAPVARLICRNVLSVVQ